MVDLHSHVLPGLDDGAADLAESLSILRSMAADGIRIVAATPHVNTLYPTAPDAAEKALTRLRDAAANEGLAIDVRGGGELALERVADLSPDDLARWGLAGNPGLLLVECPYAGWSPTLETVLLGLLARDVRPVLAHPERTAAVQRAPELLEPLVGAGVVVQVTAPSLWGRFGRGPARTARALVSSGLAHTVASDAHGASTPGHGLRAAANLCGPAELVRWLVEDVPAALVAGEPPPPRPASTRRRRWLTAGRRLLG